MTRRPPFNDDPPGQPWLLKAAVVCLGIFILSRTPVSAYEPVRREVLAALQVDPVVHRWVSIGGIWGVTTGHSMEPLMSPGCIVLEERVDTAGLKAGDIVCYEGGHPILTCHRVERLRRDRDGTWLYISGDNNLWPDGWMNASKVKFVVRRVLAMQ